ATFTGSETISVEVTEPVDQFVLNAAELDLTSVSLRVGGTTIPAEVELDEKLQRATLRFPRAVDAGEAELDIEFSGILNDQLHGFYRSTFTDVDGVEQTVATTQFEATDARRAFPCWDEPDFKASFQVSMVVSDDLFVVSNTTEESRRAVGDKVEVRFAETMVMSTYLVAFVVGPFEATEPVDVDGIPVRIVTPKGKLHLAPYAMDCAVFCLRYLRDYYEIPYPGDKVDHVAIPDFAFGAMENLGCITYREAALLLDAEQATQAEKLRVLDVVGHELAHMWFGDLVTMKWWNGIWLNEAFATFMEMKATDSMRPDWKRWLVFGAVDRPWALEIDQLSTSRAVEFEVQSPDEANEMFDALTYGKGSSVLRMIEQFIGEEAFRNGVGAYLRAHSYSNTVTADLWAGLDAASEWPVGDIMDTWILQPGYPQIEVDATGSGVRLRQRRFLAIPDDSDTASWKVPVQLRGVAGGETFDQRVLLEDAEVTVDLPGEVEWVVANAGGHGFYRVSYSTDLFDALVARLQELEALERYVLLDDADAFVLSGQLDAPSVLRLLEAYADESEQAIWQLVLRVLASTEHHVIADAQLDRFHRLVQRLLSPTAERLGWEPKPDESDLTRRLRGQLLLALGGRLGRLGSFTERGIAVAEKVLDRDPGIDPDVALAALFIAADNGDVADYERMLLGYKGAEDPQQERRFLEAVCRFDDAALAERTVAHTLDGTIRLQESFWILTRVLGGRDSGTSAWRAIRSRWDDILAAVPQRLVARILDGIP
ncbi:MAG TPA: M1 family metallopeptidase, partial [Acidimicrobiia bacterium]|nr:M1 family metallopeptidase [Acidimicrobiia bacterium]